MGIALYGLRDFSLGLRRRVPLFLSPDGTELLVTPQGKRGDSTAESGCCGDDAPSACNPC